MIKQFFKAIFFLISLMPISAFSDFIFIPDYCGGETFGGDALQERYSILVKSLLPARGEKVGKHDPSLVESARFDVWFQVEEKVLTQMIKVGWILREIMPTLERVQVKVEEKVKEKIEQRRETINILQDVMTREFQKLGFDNVENLHKFVEQYVGGWEKMKFDRLDKIRFLFQNFTLYSASRKVFHQLYKNDIFFNENQTIPEMTNAIFDRLFRELVKVYKMNLPADTNFNFQIPIGFVDRGFVPSEIDPLFSDVIPEREFLKQSEKNLKDLKRFSEDERIPFGVRQELKLHIAFIDHFDLLADPGIAAVLRALKDLRR